MDVTWVNSESQVCSGNQLQQYGIVIEITAGHYLHVVPLCNGIDQRVKVERWQIRILSLYEHNIRKMIPRQVQQ